MNWAVDQLWLVPVLPLVAAALGALLPRSRVRTASGLAIGALAASLVLSVSALAWTMAGGDADPAANAAHAVGAVVGEDAGVSAGVRVEGVVRGERNFDWLQVGGSVVRLGWVLDPLTAVMLVMVTFVGLLIFVFSTGYMAQDPNAARFFCFLSLFAAAMLGLVLSNSLLLLFICWELVGLASYLLIGFWYQKPAAAAAARKAFLTTRVGDLGFLIGLVWLYGETGTLLCYDGGRGCLEAASLGHLAGAVTVGGMAVSTAIGLLLFCGAVGKSGQLPLHVWLPDAMEGPTPVSALIHAATMVAAGVFLVARVHPLMSALPPGVEGVSTALEVVAWVGALTAVFAALVAVAQSDIKRILAYSTVSQLGYMFVGLAVGGVAVGMFHLLTHAFFKALLFLGAGSVIHGCHEEQDVRRMGGLRKHMPVTFVAYGAGMLALCGVPVFAGFWSKDAILHAAQGWGVSQGPFVLLLAGAVLTAFYMTRQMALVFGGSHRGEATGSGHGGGHGHGSGGVPHESPAVMTMPLVVLAVFAVGLGFLGTPFAPWLQGYLEGAGAGHGGDGEHGGAGVWLMMGVSMVVVALGMGLGWWLYGRQGRQTAEEADELESRMPAVFGVLERKFFVDEVYERTVVSWARGLARWCDRMDERVLGVGVTLVGYVATGLGWVARLADEYLINLGFDAGCGGLREGGGWLARLQDGKVHHYLRALGVAVVTLLLLLTWGCGR